MADEVPVGIIGGDVRPQHIEVDALWVHPSWRGSRPEGHVAILLMDELGMWAVELGVDLETLGA